MFTTTDEIEEPLYVIKRKGKKEYHCWFLSTSLAWHTTHGFLARTYKTPEEAFKVLSKMKDGASYEVRVL
jgi:hypothetical protein